MEEVVTTFPKGPLNHEGLRQMLEACKGTVDAKRLHRLCRLWTAVMLHVWLEQILDTNRPHQVEYTHIETG